MRHRSYCLIVLGCFLLAISRGRADEPRPALDSAGDALPARAKGRLGTLRFRNGEAPYHITLFSGDGKRIIRAGNTDEVLILDALTGLERSKVKLEKYTPVIVAAALSEDGTIMAWFDGSAAAVHLHNLDTGKELLVIPELKGCLIDSLQLSGDGSTLSLVANRPAVPPKVNLPSQNKYFVDVWETKTGKKRASFESLHNQSVQMVMSQDGKLLAGWGWQQPGIETEEDREIRRTVQVWDVETGKARTRIVTGHQQVGRVAISRDDKKLLVADATSGLSLYALDTGKLLRKWATRMGLGRALLTFAPDGDSIAAGTDGCFIQVWETETGKRLDSCQGPHCGLRKVLFPAKGKVIAIGEDCQALRYWEVSSEETPEELTGHCAPTNALQFLPGNQQIVTAGHDGRIMFWDAKTHALLKQVDRFAAVRGNYLQAMPGEFSPNGKYLVAFSEQGLNTVYDVATGKVLFELPGTNLGQIRPALSAANHLLALPMQKQNSGRWEIWLAVWNLETAQEVRQFKLPWPDIAFTALSPDGATVAAVRNEFVPNLNAFVVEVMAWNVTTGKEQFQFKLTAAPLTGVTFSPDGRVLLIGLQTGLLWVTDTKTGADRKLIQVATNEYTITSPLAFAPDGRTFAVVRQRGRPTGGVESKIQIWETASRSIRQEFPGHMAAINSFTFAPDGKTLGSTSNDTTALLWDLTGLDSYHPQRQKLDAKKLNDLWETLNNPSAEEGFRALVHLAFAPGDTVTFLREHLQPAGGSAEPTNEQIVKWIKELDDDDFKVREKASAQLAQAGKLAEQDLTRTLAANPSTEVTERIKRLLEKLTTQDQARAILRPLRALEVLERIGTPEAKEIVKKLAGGKTDAALTQAAKATLQRLR